MKRRNALRSLSAITGHLMFPGVLTAFLHGCRSGENIQKYAFSFFKEDEIPDLVRIIDHIIPETDTPSASATRAHIFVDMVFSNCLSEEDQIVFRDDFNDFFNTFKAQNQPLAWLEETDRDAYQRGDKAFHCWIPLKQYATIGFFTSKTGVTEALNHLPTPGSFKGIIQADAATKSMANTNLHFYL